MRVFPFLEKEHDANFQNKPILDSYKDQQACSWLHRELGSFNKHLLSIYCVLSAGNKTVNRTIFAHMEVTFFMDKRKKES